MSNKKISVPRSNCCNAAVTVGGLNDFPGENSSCTMFHICTECHCPCDIHMNNRKRWEINPKTRIISNKKKDRLFSDKEIRKMMREEDF